MTVQSGWRASRVQISRVHSAAQAVVHPHELTERDWRRRALSGGEGIDAQRVCEAHDDDRQTQRIQPRLEKLQLIRQGRERSALLDRNLLQLLSDHGSD